MAELKDFKASYTCGKLPLIPGKWYTFRDYRKRIHLIGKFSHVEACISGCMCSTVRVQNCLRHSIHFSMGIILTNRGLLTLNEEFGIQKDEVYKLCLGSSLSIHLAIPKEIALAKSKYVISQL